ncbi:hypothetical protein CK203_074329 [Vitis vinifera]|uniref:DUF4283 domain-containing protein n=1 Tax=Vitis vinifera TaxID=29760 RepID=A0A438BZ61_VITVI|nr:hypothetical protein CK203_074329 [Vitis vinifera]
MRESEGDLASEGREGESRAENRGKRKRNSFVVESKMFEVVAEERNGKRHAIILESKGGGRELHPLRVTDWRKGDLVSIYQKGKGKGRMGFYGGVPTVAREEELESLGWSAARAWGLKGKLGMARMGKGCALLEFETVEEAKRVLAAGDGDRKEAWVRILGLPISLWVPSVLRRVGEECGEFLGIDPLTERKEELEWARVQVKMNGGALPSSLEIGVEGEIYVVSLWWEIPPAIRKEQGDGRDVFGQQRGEVRGGVDPCAGWRVGGKSSAGI